MLTVLVFRRFRSTFMKFAATERAITSDRLTPVSLLIVDHPLYLTITMHAVLQPVAAILGGPGGQRTPHFPEWGVTYKAVTPRF